jgi:hypothetical protein
VVVAGHGRVLGAKRLKMQQVRVIRLGPSDWRASTRVSAYRYRRLGLLLARQGIRLNHKKLYRLYKEERLSVRKRGGRKRALGTRAPMAIPQDRNLRWSLAFRQEDDED